MAADLPCCRALLLTGASPGGRDWAASSGGCVTLLGQDGN
jgi:hypothetical protein